MNLVISEKDQIVMSLVHYFIVEENYTPIIVKGVKDEIWLENIDAPYKIIRINSNHIHNIEQLEYDILKIKGVVKQIKRKTMSFSVNTLNILIDSVKLPQKEYKNIDMVKLDEIDDILKNEVLTSTFKKIKSKLSTEKYDIEQIISKTEDVNKKTEDKNRVYEDIFKPKKIIVTNILLLVNILYFIYIVVSTKGNLSAYNLVLYGANFRELVQAGEIYRLVSCMFIHASVLHLFFNMYALRIVGSQLESYLGKIRFLFIYFISGIAGSLFSLIFSDAVSVGASGAIFGLFGSLLYFSYSYRVLLGNKVKYELMPIIIFNIVLGFLLPGIDVFAHLGGVAAGVLATMALGLPGKENKSSVVNGFICLAALFAFLTYIVFMYI